MKILFLARRFYPDVGGVEKHCLRVAAELISKGHDVSIITESGLSTAGRKLKNYHSTIQSDTYSIKLNQTIKSVRSRYNPTQSIEVISIKSGNDNWFKKFRVWRALLSKLRLIRDADIIHCHDVFYWYLPFRFIFPRKKVYTTFHGYEGYPIRIKDVLVRKISEVLSSGSICVGDFMKKWYKATPEYVIYGGVDVPDKFKSVSKPFALFFGRLDEQTNVLEYCKAVEKIQKKIPNFKLLIAGDGKYSHLVKKYGKLIGFVNNPEKLINEYRFIFVSRYLSILEALAAKKEVFAFFDNPLKEDYLKMAPFAKYIHIFNNVNDLADKVQLYCSNNKIDQSSREEAFEWVKKKSWENVAVVYERLWGLR